MFCSDGVCNVTTAENIFFSPFSDCEVSADCTQPRVCTKWGGGQAVAWTVWRLFYEGQNVYRDPCKTTQVIVLCVCVCVRPNSIHVIFKFIQIYHSLDVYDSWGNDCWSVYQAVKLQVTNSETLSHWLFPPPMFLFFPKCWVWQNGDIAGCIFLVNFCLIKCGRCIVVFVYRHIIYNYIGNMLACIKGRQRTCFKTCKVFSIAIS